MFKKLSHNFQRALSPIYVFIDYPRKKDVVFLASSARSGSTWVQNIISSSDSFRVMFEPFWNEKTKILSHWNTRQYINKYDKNNEYYKSVKNIIDGNIRSTWIDSDNISYLPRKRLIKDVRANLFLAWLKRSFPNIKIVYLLRNPFSVAKSYMRLGWSNVDLNRLTKQKDLMENHFSDDIDFFMNIRDPFLKLMVLWSIENIVALRELEKNDAVVVAYEDLLLEPKRELERIFSHLEIHLPHDLDEVISKRSRTSWNEKETKAKTLDQTVKNEGMMILNRFGLDFIYDDDEYKAPEIYKKNILTHF